MLDTNLSPGLADFFRGNAAMTTELGLRPEADDFDVISLASERHALLVTAVQGFIRICKIWQEQSRDCLYGAATPAPRYRIPEADHVGY